MNSFKVMILIAGVLVCLAGTALADPHEDAFPGISPTTGRIGIFLPNAITVGLQAYYRINGHWPPSWEAVADAGLWQAPLIGYHDEVIDPDDLELDRYGDIVYSGVNEYGLATISWSNNSKGPQVQVIQVPVPMTYAEYFALLETGEIKEHGCASRWYTEWLLDDDLLELFGTIFSIRSAISEFHANYGRLPESIEELIKAGISPVDFNSINPMTGETYRFDGSPGEIYYSIYEGDLPAIQLYCFDREGEKIQLAPF